MKRIGTTAFLALTITACGGSDFTKPASQATGASAGTQLSAVTIHSARQRHGTLEMQAEGETAWRPLNASASPARVRATGKGAMFEFGPTASPIGRVWLRGGAEIAIARDGRGVVHTTLAAGQARIALSQASTRAVVHTGDGAVPLAARDALLQRDATGTHLAATNDAPRQALWSYNVETGQLEPAGVGNLEVGRGNSGKHLALRRLLVSVKTAGDLAITEVEHVFYNPSDQQVEGTFRFPMPEGAMLLGLSMEIGGKMMHGELVEKHKARRVYESIVNEMQDPALLEWEQGRWFKLRVFPIEANKEKRVVLRYAVPLTRAVHGWEYAYATASPAMQRTIDRFDLRFNGKLVESHENFVAGRDVVVSIPRSAVPAVTRETHGDATYTFARVTPPWLTLLEDAPSTSAAKLRPRSLVVIFDTSRSSLEERKLSLQTLRTLLDDLSSADEFVVIASDVTTRAHANSMQPAVATKIKAAMDFVTAIEPDGASDLGRAFEHAGRISKAARAGRSVDVVYLGDGTATWGETDAAALSTIATNALGRARLHGALIGKGASTDLWRPLVGSLGGRMSNPRSLFQAKRFAFLLARSTATPRIERATVTIAGKTTHFPTTSTTLFLGDTIPLVMETPKGEPLPTRVTLTGQFRGKPVTFDLPLATAIRTTHVARRFASQRIAMMEKSGANKDDIVKLSKDFGVMSRHTSFLVLESDAAYKKYKIKRKNAKAAAANKAAPQVTGGDLRSLRGRSPSLSPDEFQPGDPEIRIPAPADARSVIAVFPFGETKIATWDEAQQVWLVRFLIDKETRDGNYEVRIRITHADGRLQSLRLPYVVDTRAPKVKVRVKKRGSRYTIYVDQIESVFEMKRIMGEGSDRSVTARRKAMVVARDIALVEVRYPDGQTRIFRKSAPGSFYRVWRPRTRLAGPVTLRIVVTDRARNQSIIETIIDPETTR